MGEIACAMEKEINNEKRIGPLLQGKLYLQKALKDITIAINK